MPQTWRDVKLHFRIDLTQQNADQPKDRTELSTWFLFLPVFVPATLMYLEEMVLKEGFLNIILWFEVVISYLTCIACILCYTYTCV